MTELTDSLTSPVLVLNRHWAAFKVVTAAEAFVLLFKGTAEVIDVDDDRRFYNYDFETWCDLSDYKEQFERDRYTWVQCVSSRLAVPTVVKLMKFDRVREQKIRFSRRNIYARDRQTCQYCGKRFKTVDLNLDHVLPRSQGGISCWENIVCSCIDCNSAKGGRTPEQAGMKLIRKPCKPKSTTQLIPMHHESWKHFVDAAYWNVELRE